MVLKEKSNFDNIEKAAKYFYADYVDGDSAYIRATLSKLGHSETFIDAVFDAMSARYDEEELYLDDLDECLNEDSWDDILKPKKFYIPDVWEDWKFDVAQAAEKLCGLSLDNLDYDDDSQTIIVTVDGYDSLGFEKYQKLYNWVVRNVYPEQNSYDLDESVNVVYDKGGKTNRFYLDFNNPSDLYRELEKHCGYDFATQFRDEFEHWKEINIDEVKECWSGDMTDVRDILGEALDSLEKVSLYMMKNGTVPEIDDLRDIINESEDKIGEAKAIADDFFNYGFGSED